MTVQRRMPDEQGSLIPLKLEDSPPMTFHEAKELLEREVQRLRSGAGGHGGRSPQALDLATAIEMILGLARSRDH